MNNNNKKNEPSLDYIHVYTNIAIITHMYVWYGVKRKSLSCVQLFATPWTITCQALLSMGFSRQEHWSG